MASKYQKLEDFKALHVEFTDLADVIQKRAETCRADIESNARSKGWGPYAESWRVSFKKGKTPKAVVHSEQYQLTHLLENGHLIVNKKEGTGWSPPIKHISTAYNQNKQEFINEMKNIGLKIE